jgi:hypothetical protein
MRECRLLCWMEKLGAVEQNVLWRYVALLAHGSPEIKQVIMFELMILETALRHDKTDG